MFPRSSNRVNTPNPPATSLRVQTSVLGTSKPVGWGQTRIAGNLLWYGGFTAIPHTTQSGNAGGKGITSGGGGKGGGSSNTTYTYTVGVLFGLCEGPISAVLNVWNNKTLVSLASLNLTLLSGTYAQSPWAYLSTNFPSFALNYRGTAALGAGPMDLDTSQELPNLSYEVQFAINSAISGLPDADPMDILTDALTNSHYGMGFPSARIGDLTIWSNYCRALGIVLSPALTASSAANAFIADMMKATNSEAVWSGGKLTVVPYGDQTVTGHGSTYVAPSSPLYAIGETDLLPAQGGAAGTTNPVDVRRVRQADTKNQMRIEFLDRANAYNPDVVTAQDEADVLTFGVRPSDVAQLHMICDRAAALMSAQLMLGRETIRNLPTFTLGPEFILLDPMDIIEYVDTALGANNQWVRIREIQENQDGSLTFSLEEYNGGSASAPIYGNQANSGFTPNYNASPGSALAPAIFDVPVSLADAGPGLEIWLATAGGATWGGCEVWVSSDNATYALAGKLIGPSRMGVLTANIASGSDPDTTNTLAVDLTNSRGALTGGTLNDANRLNTLCFVDGEYMSYQQATLTSQYHYDLGKHGGTAGLLRRGQLGSAIASHLTGSLFVRLDETVFTLPYSRADVGQTIWFKLVSFNVWMGGIEDIASVTAYSHVIGGPPTLYAPTALTANPALKTIQLSWTNPLDIGVEAIEIWRSTTSSFGSAVHINDAAAYASWYSDDQVTAGTAYWYWIRIRDRAGNFSAYNPSSGGAGATATAAQVATADIGTGAVTNAKIASGAIDTLKFASGITPVEIFSTAPVTGNFEGRQYYNTTDGFLYKYHSGAWNAFVNGKDLVDYTVLPNKVLIGATDNLILDAVPNVLGYWSAVNTSLFLSAGNPSPFNSVGTIGWSNTSGAVAQLYHNKVTCLPGDQFYCFSYVANTGFSNNMQMYIIEFNAAGTQVSATNIQNVTISGGPFTIGGNYTVPAGVFFISLSLAQASGPGGGAYAILGAPVLRRRVNAQLVVDGEIIAGKLAVGAINATAIVVDNILVTGKLVANAVTNTVVGTGGTSLVPTGSYGTVASCSITTVGGQVLVNFTDYWTWAINGPRGAARVVNDLGTLLNTIGLGGGSCPDAILLAGTAVDNSGAAGARTYYLQEQYFAGAQPTSQLPYIVATELKR